MTVVEVHLQPIMVWYQINLKDPVGLTMSNIKSAFNINQRALNWSGDLH
jgi:hypothetical protein